MADISSITLPSGSTYDFKDLKAREAIALEYDPLYHYSIPDLCFYDGVLYVCTDDTPNPAGDFDEDYWLSTNLADELSMVADYIGDDPLGTTAQTLSGAINEVNDAVSSIDTKSIPCFGICNTSASTMTKEVTISGITSLSDGQFIRVLFVSAQTYGGTPKLKLNNFDAYNIQSVNQTDATFYEWAGGAIIDFVYKSSSSTWIMVNSGHATTTYYGKTKLSNSYTSASETFAATSKAVKYAYDLASSKLDSNLKGAAGGVAELDSNGKVPASQIPFDEVELPFMITKQPQPFVLETSSGNVTFSIEVSGGSGTYTYQWQMMTAALPWTDATGATSSSWTVSAGTTNIGMIARCVVSDGTDTLISDTAYYYGQDDASDNLKYAVNDGNYGVCSTAGETQIKVVTIPGLVVKTGVTIHVRFMHANTANLPQLNVNGCGAKYLVLYGNSAVGTYSATSGWQDDSIVAFTYNGTYWVRDQAYNTNTMSSNPAHGNGYGTCTTAASETAKEVTMSGYYLGDGGIVVIHFENNVPASSTLNINGKGAKSIYAKSSFGVGTIGANVIKAGDTATFIYTGTHYLLISIDRHNLVFDANPTQGSTNLMTSGALYTGFSLFADELAKLYLNDAQAFSNQSTYSVGALRVYNGELYQCHTAVETAGDWTGSTNWTRKSLGEFIETYKNLATLEYVVVT